MFYQFPRFDTKLLNTHLMDIRDRIMPIGQPEFILIYPIAADTITRHSVYLKFICFCRHLDLPLESNAEWPQNRFT